MNFNCIYNSTLTPRKSKEERRERMRRKENKRENELEEAVQFQSSWVTVSKLNSNQALM